jgi:hypothetical protein
MRTWPNDEKWTKHTRLSGRDVRSKSVEGEYTRGRWHTDRVQELL